MSWSSQQQRRLGMEKGILEKKLKNVSWFNPTSKGNTRVEWRANTNNGKGYTLRVYIPNDFPDQCLIMVVSSPSSPLKRKNGSFLNSSSGAQNTLSAYDGLTQMCHFNSGQWMSQNTLYQILMKGRFIARNRGHFAPVINCQRNLISKWRTKTIVVRESVSPAIF